MTPDDPTGRIAARAERRHNSSGSDPFRTRFRQDRDRVLYSAGFRRLAGITQISAASEIHLFHNRLTHSLKVGQVGRTLAEQLLVQYSDVLSCPADLDPDVVEAAGLAHDIGHPPFGHAGESVLSARMEALTAGGFEGNAQAFRYLGKTALRRMEATPGDGALDLTRATLNAVIKYPWSYAEIDTGSIDQKLSWDDRNRVPARKYNAYSVDLDLYRWARGDAPLGRRTLEASIMDWADDISYAVHDFEDYVRAGLIPLHALESSIEPFSQFAWAALHQRFGSQGFSRESFERAVEDVVRYSWNEPYDGTRASEDKLGRWVSRRITETQESTRLANPGLFGFSEIPCLEIDSMISYRIEVLKLVPFYFVVSSPGFDLAQRGQQRLLGRVFDSLLEMAARRPISTPPGLVAVLNSLDMERVMVGVNEANPQALPARAVCDYLCTLTERQVVELDRRLNGGAESMLSGDWLP